MLTIRVLIWVSFRKDGAWSTRWTKIAIISSATSGLLWGAAGFLFYPDGSEAQRMVLAFILGGMGAGAVTGLAPCLPAFRAYLIPSVVPFCIQLVRQGSAEHFTMAAACALYLVALMILGNRAHGWLRESVSRRIENAELVTSLERRVANRTAQLNEINECLHHDIEERRRAEATLAKYGERQAAIADFGRLALSGMDLDTLFNQAVALVLERLEVAGAAVLEDSPDLHPPEYRAVAGIAHQSMDAALTAGLSDHAAAPWCRSGAPPTFEAWSLDQAWFGNETTTAQAVIAQRDGRFGVLIAISTAPHIYSPNDVSFLQSIANMLAAAIERKQAEYHLQKLALRDPLTGLANRGLFFNHLAQELTRAKRTHAVLAVLLLDLDNFKHVNDTLGHPAGDQLLVAVAERIKMCLRGADGLARLGGDEFALILSDLHVPEDAALVAQKVVSTLSKPFSISDQKLHIGVSVGITMSPGDSDNVDSLLRNADLALYRAKMEGRSTYRFYAEDMGATIKARKALEDDLRGALRNDELLLAYQPRFDLVTGRIGGAEALLRWRHPTRGVLLPDDFMPVAEAAGLIGPLGRWVLDHITDQTLAWRNAALPPVSIATTLTLSQCRLGSLTTVIQDVTARTGGDLAWLELEVSEQVFLPPANPDAIATLGHLRRLGATISLRNFGTGYSNLGSLRTLPVRKLKLDKALIADLDSSHDAEMVVRGIIAFARNLGLTIAADGVDNLDQFTFLTAEGCTSAQGNFLAPPLSPDAFAAMLGHSDGRSIAMTSGGRR